MLKYAEPAMPDVYQNGKLDEALTDAIESFDALRVDAILEDIPDEEGPEMERATSLEYLGSNLANVAQTLFGDVSDEVAPNWKQARQIMEYHEHRPFVLEALQIELARVHTPQTRGMAERCFEITRDVLPSLPDSITRDYLRLLARSYIAGFFPEATMLAGSVLEQELRAVFERKRADLPGIVSGRSEIRARLATARAKGWLSKEGLKAADTVLHRRNKTTHQEPGLSTNCLETIRLTVRVLQELVGVQ